MRLTLLFICLFSILGGCAASSSHGVVVPKLISYSGKHQSALPGAHGISFKGNVDLSAACFADDDIDDDDDRESLTVRKYKIQINTAVAFAQLAGLCNIRCYSVAPTLLRGNLPHIYILRRTLRV